MAAELFVPPSKALDANANPYAGAKWFFYATGTTTPQSVYTTAALNVAHANPVVADSSGKFANIFFDETLIYRGVLKNADESVTLHDIDPITRNTGRFLSSGVGATVRALEAKLRDTISIKDFGAVGDGVADDTAAIQAAIDANPTNADILAPKGTYRITATIVFPLTSKNIRLIGYGARFVVTGTHSCIDITAQNENYGWHSIEGLTIIGPNNYYGASMANSTGFGIGARRTTNMNNACYNSVIRDCNIEGFEYGIRLRNAIKLRVEGKTFIQFNNYGIYIDGEVVNANNFNDVVISRNAVAGVYSAETVVAPAPTNNVFSGCLMESNHPYLVVPVTGGVAVYLDNAYDYIFDNCYTEDHEFSFRIVGGSKGNKFINCRVAPGGFGEDSVSIEGADTWGNVFENCKSATVLRTTPNVYTNHASQLYNQFINCEGFNFISPNVVKMPYVQNMRPVDYSSTLGGMGYLGIPEHGMRENAFEGTVPGTITGIGTATATLNCFGLGEILISDAVAAAGTNTTITTFTGLQKGQMLVVWNYQTARDVTIKSTDIFGAIVLKNATDATFTDFGQMIVFYVNQYGRAYEVGRNF